MHRLKNILFVPLEFRIETEIKLENQIILHSMCRE